MAIVYLDWLSVVLSFVAAVIMAIPLLRFRRVQKALNARPRQVTETAEIVFGNAVDASALLQLFKEQRDYTSAGIVVLFLSVAVGLLSHLV